MRRTTMTKRTASRRLQAFALLGGLVLLATALAGCTTAQATASQLQVTAQDRAAQWDDEAQLVMIMGTEGTIQMQAMLGAFGVEAMDSEAMEDALQQDFWQRVQDDPEPGDGRTEFWLYIFRAGDGQSHLLVVVDKDREILYDEETNGADLGVPVGGYNLDSNQVMKLALQENPYLKEASERDSFGFVLALYREAPNENPRWIVAGGGGSPEGGGGGLVVIDARSGDILETEGGSGAPADWSNGGAS